MNTSGIIQEYVDTVQIILEGAPETSKDTLEVMSAYYLAQLKLQAATPTCPPTTQQSSWWLWWVLVIILLVVIIALLFSKVKLPKVRWE